jgi:hypothetical protein
MLICLNVDASVEQSRTLLDLPVLGGTEAVGAGPGVEGTGVDIVPAECLSMSLIVQCCCKSGEAGRQNEWKS